MWLTFLPVLFALLLLSLFFFKYLSYICQTVNFLLSLSFFSKLRSRLIKPTVRLNGKKLKKKKKRNPLYNYQSRFNPSVISFYNHFLLSDQISDVCKKNYMRDLYRKIDGAVLMSQLEKDLDCTITFQTHSILQRFMLRFDQLQLDCNDHLYIYDGAHAVSSYKVSPSVPFQSGILWATGYSDFIVDPSWRNVIPICIQIGMPKLDVCNIGA